ncbi:VWA domain-containing protein [Hyphomicrobium sp.]|uniref:vWA domain-containing protein n=1 Tax=Hyphomicrobium sp. TaxID=82 RepID=UPI000F97E674|nr:VWA domain-containing protein [Hyphomicrobium sp.]RUO99204.1 MAG: VWA domain-containing protein [Hyphomicrobium sp.]
MRLRFLRLIRIAGLAAASLAVIALAATGAARSEDAPTTMIILDGSGSMWGRLAPDNRAKIDIAREKLGALLSAPSKARVGLIAFGHRRRGDCNDVELIAPPDAARQDVLDPIAKLNPKGPGPVTAAIKMAADAIAQSRPAQIIVIADNADNCRQDSCAAARDIAKSSPGVAIQVIGVGVPANERPRLACVAEATGGRYYDITDSNGLNAALDETTKLAILSPGEVAGATEPTTPPPPPAGASLRASAALVEGGPLLKVPLTWRVYKTGGTTVLGQGFDKDISVKLPAGEYDIEAELGGIKVRRPIKIADGEAQSIVLPLDAAHLAVRAIAAKGATPATTAVLTLSSSDAPVSIQRGGMLDVYLKPANYSLIVVDGTARVSQTLSLAAGDDKPVDIMLSTGTLKVSATGGDGKPLSDVLLTVETDDPESPNGRREVARSRSSDATFSLTEGTYYIGAHSANGSVSKRVGIGAGQSVSETLAVKLVPVTISALVAGAAPKADQNIFYRVDRIDGDRVSIARAIGPALSLDLSPGRYRVTASLAVSHLSASQEIAVEDGKPAKAVIDIASGQVNFVPAAGAVPAFGDVYWEVSDTSGMPIWRATGSEATAVLAPGKYTVRFDVRDKHGKAAFEVRAGESQKIEIGPG